MFIIIIIIPGGYTMWVDIDDGYVICENINSSFVGLSSNQTIANSRVHNTCTALLLKYISQQFHNKTHNYIFPKLCHRMLQWGLTLYHYDRDRKSVV